MTLNLVQDWKDAWKWSSVRMLGLAGLIQSALLTAPTALLQYLPDWATHTLSVSVLVLTIGAGLGRITTTETPNVPNPPS